MGQQAFRSDIKFQLIDPEHTLKVLNTQFLHCPVKLQKCISKVHAAQAKICMFVASPQHQDMALHASVSSLAVGVSLVHLHACCQLMHHDIGLGACDGLRSAGLKLLRHQLSTRQLSQGRVGCCNQCCPSCISASCS